MRQLNMESFLNQHGWGSAQCRVLADDASFRRYFRLMQPESGAQAVLMDAPPPKEDIRPFASLARHLHRLGFTVPHPLAEDADQGFMLLDDLGDNTFTRCLQAHSHNEETLYAMAIDVLADLHRLGDVAIPSGLPPYDLGRLMAEVNLLPDWYLPEILGTPLTDSERSAWEDMWNAAFPAALAVPQTLVLRDYHVDNLMVVEKAGKNTCGLLDFQDALAGPITYDLMSLLEDARRDINPALITNMRHRYLNANPGLDPTALAASWDVLAAQRHAKVIGIFTRLMRRDHKPKYLEHIPRLWRLLDAALKRGAAQVPALADIDQWLGHKLPPEQRTVPHV